MRLIWAFRGLKHWREIARFASDEGFSATAGLPILSTERLEEIGRYPVVLPPSSCFMWGTQDPEGMIFLASLAQHLEADTIFEIGTFTGATAWCLAENTEATVHTLDLPADRATILGVETTDEAFRQEFTERVYEQLGSTNVKQHLGDSATFDFSPFHNSCDLVYVDGAHSYDYVQLDTENALKMLKPRGAIVWDDYYRRWPGVVSYLDSRTDLDIRRVPRTRLAVFIVYG